MRDLPVGYAGGDVRFDEIMYGDVWHALEANSQMLGHGIAQFDPFVTNGLLQNCFEDGGTYRAVRSHLEEACEAREAPNANDVDVISSGWMTWQQDMAQCANTLRARFIQELQDAERPVDDDRLRRALSYTLFQGCWTHSVQFALRRMDDMMLHMHGTYGRA
jgi:hypothetical protein